MGVSSAWRSVAGHHVRLELFDQRAQCLHRAAAPVDHRGIGDIGPHAGEDLVQAVERDVIVEFGDEDEGASRLGPAMLRGIGRLGAGS